MKNKVLLVVDDEPDLREIVATEFEYMGAKVFLAENVSQALAVLKNQKIDLIISDIRMPGATGVDLLHDIKIKNVDGPPIILMTGFADITIEDALDQGAEAIISKPFKLEELIQLAVRLTTDNHQRYVHSNIVSTKLLNYSSDDSLNSKISAHELVIGRGGVAITLDRPNQKISPGEIFNFNLKFNDAELLGAAVCRWYKPRENDLKVALGLEFVQLSDDTFNYFRNYSEEHRIVPYIPRLD